MLYFSIQTTRYEEQPIIYKTFMPLRLNGLSLLTTSAYMVLPFHYLFFGTKIGTEFTCAIFSILIFYV
jgi:hypothetical protein